MVVPKNNNINNINNINNVNNINNINNINNNNIHMQQQQNVVEEAIKSEI